MRKFHVFWFVLLAAALPLTLLAQTTEFTYQGELTVSGTPQPTYQMRFRLFDAAASGSQQGSTIENTAVAVNGGIFTVTLNFGAPVFTGADRYLEIAVRRNSGESYTVLNPRQKIASSPYSIRTLSAQTADTAVNAQNLGGIPANQYLTNATVGSAFIKNDTVQQTANFNINGTGFIGNTLGVGTGAIEPGYRLHVAGNSWLTNSAPAHQVVKTTGGNDSWARYYLRSNSQSWFMGTSQAFNDNQFYLVDETPLGGGTARMTINPSGGPVLFPVGNFGIGTTNPATRLTVNGGVPWSNAGWTASMNLQNASALGWEANGSGQRFGIGQTNGGLYFFRTNSAFGNTASPANYDMLITDAGNIAQLSGGLGLPKAMIWVNANRLINRCYNGKTGVSAANAGQTACGFTVSTLNPYAVRIDFGFPVDNSFFSYVQRETVGNHGGIWTFGESPNVLTANQIEVSMDLEARAFQVIVY